MIFSYVVVKDVIFKSCRETKDSAYITNIKSVAPKTLYIILRFSKLEV